MTSKVKPTRTLLTMEQIRQIESEWAFDKGGPALRDIKKLIKHIRFVEHLLVEEKKKNGKTADSTEGSAPSL